ncbi:MAG: hypothetical protein JO317_08535, partial [Verrucomicrobiae bacterium]|nr:hypothetical protein [Verrucomicrobiae bacterium]
MNRRLVPLTVLLLFLAAASARADEKASRNAGGKVDMTVRLIYADNQNNPNVDPKLVEILKHDFGYLNYSVKFAESFKLKH